MREMKRVNLDFYVKKNADWTAVSQYQHHEWLEMKWQLLSIRLIFLLTLSPFCAFSIAWEKKQRLLWFRTHFQVAACANISLHQMRWSFFPLSIHYLFVCLFPSMYRQFLRASLLTIDFELRKILRTCKMNSNWIHQCYIGMNAWYGIGDCIISSDSKLRVISNSQSIQF